MSWYCILNGLYSRTSRRSKLSHDPNNTGWSRSTTNFGHRILSQQGWQPGQYLGAENANHSDHYTAANASHIRILLREDNLGLGAKVGGNKAETFGLSLFSGVLGRLNGNSDEQVQKQQDALRDAELRQYQVGKYGLMNFVSGGLLVGERIEKRGGEKIAPGSGSEGAQGNKEGRGKKRKPDEGEGDEVRSKAKKHKIRKVQDAHVEAAPVQSKSRDLAKSERSRGKKRKKDKYSADRPASDELSDEPSDTAIAERKSEKRRKKRSTDDTPLLSTTADEESRIKEEKRSRKEDRRKRKEARQLKREAKRKAELTATAPTQPATQPASGGRHAVRHRYIQQKRMAGMDAQAMKEIFMIKGAA